MTDKAEIERAKEMGRAYAIAKAYAAGRRHRNSKGMAQDKDVWRTTENHHRIMLDDKTGEVKAGMGGKFNGKRINEIHKDFTGPHTPSAAHLKKAKTQMKLHHQKENLQRQRQEALKDARRYEAQSKGRGHSKAIMDVMQHNRDINGGKADYMSHSDAEKDAARQFLADKADGKKAEAAALKRKADKVQASIDKISKGA